VSTAAQPVRDPYADYGGNVAAPEQDAAPKQADPYQAYGGTVAPPAKPSVPAPAAPVTKMGAPETMGAKAERWLGTAEKWLGGTDPAVSQRAYEQMKQPGLTNKIVGGTEYLVSGVPFAGAPLAKAMQESGEGEYKKAALHTAEAIPQAALLPFAGEKVAAEAVGREGAEYLPEAGQALRKAGTALLDRPVAREAAAVAEPELATAADPYVKYGGASAEPTGEHLPAVEMHPPTEAAPATTEAEPATTPATAAPGTSLEALRQVVDPERIESRADVDKAISDAGDILKHNPEIRAGRKVTFAEQRQLADNLGMTADELTSAKPTSAFNAEELLAARAVQQASLTNLMNEARVAAMGDEDALNRFVGGLAKHQQVTDALRAKISEAGRGLGSLRNAPAARTIQAAIDALSGLPRDAQLQAVRDMLRIDPNDAPAMERFVRQVTPSSTADKIHEYWINAILSGGTAAKKAVADTAMRVLGVAERPTAAALDAARALATGTGRERFFGETGADLYGMFHAMPEALSQFWSTFAHDQGFDQVLDPLSGGREHVPAIKGMVGQIVRTSTRLLEAVTDAAQVVNYNAERYALAYRQAAKEGLSGSELLGRAEELAANPSQEMRDAAYDYAKRRTFTQELGKTGKLASQLTHRPGVRYMVPFARIPLNIAKAGMEYSPLGFARPLVGMEQTPETAARAVIGTALAAAFLKHALNGNITGSGAGLSPSDRLRLEAKGWQSDSLRIGGRYYSYRYLEPIGQVLGMAADLAQAVKDKNSGAIKSISQQMTKSVGAQLANLPFLSSLLFLNRAFENPEKYAQSFGASFVPTALANVAHMADRTIRSPKNLEQQFEARIPGMTENVPPLTAPALPPGVRNTYHVMGLPLMRPRSALGGFNPFPASLTLPGLSEAESEVQSARRRRTARMGRGM
jgi:hypothetical protein